MRPWFSLLKVLQDVLTSSAVAIVAVLPTFGL